MLFRYGVAVLIGLTPVAEDEVVRGLRPVLAGRNAAVSGLARELGLEHRTFGLDAPAAVVPSLKGLTAVLNCAGPFARTAAPLAEACLQARVHYLDVTGEIGVFEALAARDAEALVAGVMLLPGVGFDVVPSDCLAVHLRRRLPAATRLALGFQSPGRMSRGTATTVVENLHKGGAVRRRGVLTPVQAARLARTRGRIASPGGPAPSPSDSRLRRDSAILHKSSCRTPFSRSGFVTCYPNSFGLLFSCCC